MQFTGNLAQTSIKEHDSKQLIWLTEITLTFRAEDSPELTHEP
jgi:hypothetical protein